MPPVQPYHSRWLAIALLIVTSLGAHAETAIRLPETAVPAGFLSPSLLNETHMTIDRSLDWLAAEQRDDGSWSDTDHPALTALPLWCFAQGEHPQREQIVSNAVEQLLRAVQPDGGIYHPVDGRVGGGLKSYNTAICITVLHQLTDPTLRTRVRPVVLRGRRFLANSRYLGESGTDGGMGYSPGRSPSESELLNAYYVSEAMFLTRDAEPASTDAPAHADLDWSRVRRLIEELQEPAAGSAAHTNDVRFRSYGSMTYAGLLTLLYADVGADDPRVRSAFAWAERHWSLDENPGLGNQGVFFFRNVLTKCLLAYGKDRIRAVDGSWIDWRAEVITALINSQEIDARGRGFWLNRSERWMENDPVLATAYAVLTLQFAAVQPIYEDPPLELN